MLSKDIIYFGQKCRVQCDGNCKKAWGVNIRPKVRLSDDPEDFEYLSDDELGIAPTDPQTYEGADAKPVNIKLSDDMNKWCARQCERSVIRDYTDNSPTSLPDFSTRVKNIN